MNEYVFLVFIIVYNWSKNHNKTTHSTICSHRIQLSNYKRHILTFYSGFWSQNRWLNWIKSLMGVIQSITHSSMCIQMEFVVDRCADKYVISRVLMQFSESVIFKKQHSFIWIYFNFGIKVSSLIDIFSSDYFFNRFVLLVGAFSSLQTRPFFKPGIRNVTVKRNYTSTWKCILNISNLISSTT